MKDNIIILMLMVIIVFCYVDLFKKYAGQKVVCHDLVMLNADQAFNLSSLNLKLIADRAEEVLNMPENYKKRIVSTGTTFICIER